MAVKRDPELHKGHRKRLMDTFIAGGRLTEIQALELLLFYCIPRVDTNELSHRLLNRFGGIFEVLNADVDEIAEIPGMGISSAKKLHYIGYLISGFSEEKRKGLY